MNAPPYHGISLKDFSELDLIEPLQRAIEAQNYVQPTPIQAQAIPPLLRERDLLGCAQTGTGKTAAFALPVLQHLSASQKPGSKRHIRALVLSPTRELASQIGDSFKAYGQNLPLRHHVVFGGVNEKSQIRAMERGVDILVACPGRLLDLQSRGYIDLSHVEFFILDEADRMLDMGFVPDVRRIMKAMGKGKRQNLLFSATLPDSVVKLASSFLSNPIRIDITPETATVDAIDQKVMFVDKSDKSALLCDLLVDRDVESTIVFTRTKRRANSLTKKLDRAGFKAMAIHGNKSQNARRRALNAFQDGSTQILVATDVAARGIDVDTVTHVFNYDLPNEPESYVHRIGRTGRAGRSGVAIAFCDDREGSNLRAIEKTIGEEIELDKDHGFHQDKVMASARSGRKSSGGRNRRKSSGRRSSGRKRRSSGRRNSGKKKGSRGRKSNSSNSSRRKSSKSSNSPRRVRRDRRPLSERD